MLFVKQKPVLVLLQLLLEERRDSLRGDNPHGRREEEAYHTPLVQ